MHTHPHIHACKHAHAHRQKHRWTHGSTHIHSLQHAHVHISHDDGGSRGQLDNITEARSAMTDDDSRWQHGSSNTTAPWKHGGSTCAMATYHKQGGSMNARSQDSTSMAAALQRQKGSNITAARQLHGDGAAAWPAHTHPFLHACAHTSMRAL